MIKLTKEDFGILSICALRYCMGRETYMPGLIRSVVMPFLGDISDQDLQIMLQDCEFQNRFNMYGDERIDKPGWINWQDMLLKEQDIRRLRKELKEHE